MRIWIFIAAAFVCSANAEPISLKGLAIGMTKGQMEEFAPGFGRTCVEHLERNGVIPCGFSEGSSTRPLSLATLAGAQVKSWVMLMSNGALSMVMARFPASEFDGVVAALTEKYGRPKSIEKTSVQNRMGASFPQIEITWRQDGTTLVAKKLDLNIETMSVQLTSDESAARAVEDAKARAKKNANDL